MLPVPTSGFWFTAGGGGRVTKDETKHKQGREMGVYKLSARREKSVRWGWE